MTDCFALLEQPRQPWLNADILREKFLELSAPVHPDRLAAADEPERAAADTQFAELNTAYQTLRQTRSRLGHLLELETGAPPPRVENVSRTLADLFFQVSGLCRQADAFLASRTAATSPVIKAGFFAQGLEWIDRLQQFQQTLAQQTDALEKELESLSDPDASLPSRPAWPVPRLEEIYRSLSYLTRWNAQLQERLVHLSV
jgi:DnaJ-domain-containing protein 1